MKISIITVCKNSEKSIEKTIQSVIYQTYKDIEYIVIDGNSKDKTKEIIARYDSSITKIISEPDNGLYEAMNKGIHLATGCFINFLNSDDYLYDTHVVSDVVDFISAHPNCEFLYGDTHLRPNPLLHKETSVWKSPLPNDIPEAMIYGALFLQGAIFFNACLFTKLGLFNENYRISADYEWFARLIEHKEINVFYYPRTIFSYYQGGLSGDIKATLSEMFKIQNQIPLFQTDYWVRKRISKLQEGIIELQEFIHVIQKLSEERRVLISAMESQITAIEIKNAELEGKIAGMEASKFWKLRNAWFKLRNAWFKKKN
ncbi:glycosyltransferase family 2 protein [Coleofasciculus sp. FACHB-1120]|uniref:glycosyltransferase family 2 protein n=1 Tax=Coleofasciculus sp. FACHB-1120 TaxID=2692783 RepID=UPI001686D37D|nr:glycosyltransferase family 2 protein [Coleofasciculus sp. FACHB-1120]MBD2743553.1 glycosyltransferase [Coleofasciculus sp. FACHB-1120]